MEITSLTQKARSRGKLWLAVVRDAFVVLMPLTFLGLVALVLQNLPWSVYREAMTALWGAHWPEHLGVLIKSTHGIFGMALAPLVAIFLARHLMPSVFDMPEIPSLVVGISSLTNFMLMVWAQPVFAAGLGHGVMLQGVVMGILTAELLQFTLRCRWLKGKGKHDGTDALYYHALQMTPAVIVSGFVVFLWVEMMGALPSVPHNVLAPLVSWAQQLPMDAVWILGPFVALFNQLACFFGVHGAHILDTYGANLFSPVGTAYTHAVFWRLIFNHFTLMGGAGATLSLIIAILITVRQGPQSRIAKLSVVPAMFNINEAVLYGLPLVLNGLYVIPFLCVPLLLTLMTLAAAEVGLVRFLPVDIFWTTPPLISGWMLTESWRGVALQVVEIGVGVAVYLPFVRAAEMERKQREATAVVEAMQQMTSDSQKLGKFVMHDDQNGLIARGLQADLREAIHSNEAGLNLVYEPKHDKTGCIVGVEALIRWTHPLYGRIPAVVVITLLENGHDIHEFGEWVLWRACMCKARWNAAGYAALTMAINVSPLQLERFELTERLGHILQKTGLKPMEVELEITESAVLPDSPSVEKTLHKLAEMGVRLSMDDFGMGYSSLLYLRRFPVHTIKIDGSLTRDVLSSSINADIIRTIVALGQSQKVEVVAEYVETLAQRDMLAELGCDVFQGHYHSPALPEAQCPAYFARHQGQKLL